MGKNNEYKPITIIPFDKSSPITTGNYQDEFLYGKSIEKIKQSQIEGSFVQNISVGHFQITGTGSKSITGLGFKPTYLEIISTVSGGTGILESRGIHSGANTYTHYIYNTNTNQKSYYVTNNIVVIEDGSSGSFINTYASFTSFDSDGFTINVGTKNQTVECTYIAR